MTPTPDPLDRDPLDRDLAALADRLDPPVVPLADDVRRGRRRAARQRLAVGGAAVGTAAVLALGFALLPGSGDDSAVGPAEGDRTTPGTTAPATPEPTATPTPSVTPIPAETTTPADPEGLDPFSSPPGDPAMMVALRRAVAGHLDPSGRHISEREIRQANESGSFDGTAWSSIVQKIGWTNPGEDGQGLVSVGVSTSFTVDCGGHYDGVAPTTCTDDDLAGLPVTRVVSPEEGESVVHRRSDGYVTSISLDDLFGNNSLTAVSGIEVTDAQLAAVLADPALDIPGHPAPTTIDRLPGTTMRDAARRFLGGSITGFETWTGSANGSWWADVRSPGGVVAEVHLSNDFGNYEVDAPCDEGFATRCEARTVDGRAVRVDHRRDSTGGGYDVTYDGPRRPIWVAVSPDAQGRTSLSVGDAVRLATDARLQRP